MREKMIQFGKSLELFERAKRAVPAQTQTFSKGWTQFPFGQSPVFLERADGGHVWDVDGNEYIDWPMAIGPLLLGHNHPAVNDAIQNQLRKGLAFSLPNAAELTLAERLIDWFPYAERVRFGKNGSDATAGAVRAARAFTGKDYILCCGYHGWQDWFIGTTTRSLGVPDEVKKLTIPFTYNDLNELESLFVKFKGKVSAVIMEPMGIIEPAPGYLEGVRKLTEDNEALLIFDECWTGFRIHLQGAYGKFGVAPDLACFGKALGNGVPISAIVGRADVMDIFEKIFFSFTFGGDMLGICAAHAVLDVLSSEPVLETAGRIGSLLMNGVAGLLNQNNLDQFVNISGYPLRSVLNFSGDGHDGLLIKSIFQQEAIASGILTAGYHAPCIAHTERDVEQTLTAYGKAFQVIAKGLNDSTLEKSLRGLKVQPVFRRP